MIQTLFNADFKRKMLIITLIVLSMSLLTVGTENGFAMYYSVFLGFMAIYVFLAAMTQMLGSSEGFLYSVVALSSLGVALQIILGAEGVGEILLFSLIGIVAGIAGAFVIKLLLKLKRRLVVIIITAATVFLYLVTFLFGTGSGDVKAWLLGFQITDVIKLLALVGICFALTDREEESALKRLAFASGIMLIHAGGMMLLREMGTLIVIAITFVCLLFTYYTRLYQSFLVVGCFLFIAVTAFFICAFCAKLSVLKVGIPGFVNKLASIYDFIVYRVDLMINLDNYDIFNEGYQQNGIREALSMAKWIGGSDYTGTVAVASKDLVFLSVISKLGVVPGMATVLAVFYMVFEACVTIANRRMELEKSSLGIALMISVAAMVFNMMSVVIAIIYMKKEDS